MGRNDSWSAAEVMANSCQCWKTGNVIFRRRVTRQTRLLARHASKSDQRAVEETTTYTIRYSVLDGVACLGVIRMNGADGRDGIGREQG